MKKYINPDFNIIYSDASDIVTASNLNAIAAEDCTYRSWGDIVNTQGN